MPTKFDCYQNGENYNLYARQTSKINPSKSFWFTVVKEAH